MMLDEYKLEQDLAYNLFVNDIRNNCVTHAYLIDENNYGNAYGMVLSFIKEVLCNDSNMNDMDKEVLCKRIDDGNYLELKIIEPDGMYIKKQQIIELQQEFSRSAVEGKKRIYIIRECEKMRTEAANSMLKFLEEPDDDIMAVLMTNNINNVLSTIISRCKIVKLNSVSSDVVEISEELDKVAIDFVMGMERRGIETIMSVKDIWFSVITAKERDKMLVVFDRMIDIYYDCLSKMMNKQEIKCSNFIEEINEIVDKNKIEWILEKINILIEGKDSIKFNVNSNLLLDKIIISIGGISNGSRC